MLFDASETIAMGHPEVPISMNRQFVLDGRRADMLPSLKHINDNPPAGDRPMREWILDSVIEELQKNPKAEGVLLNPPGTDTRFKVIFE